VELTNFLMARAKKGNVASSPIRAPLEERELLFCSICPPNFQKKGDWSEMMVDPGEPRSRDEARLSAPSF